MSVQPPPLTERVLTQLECAELQESNPHFQDDYRIAWITALRAGRGEAEAYVSASYSVLGLHPAKVWPAILERRAALLGNLTVKSLPPKKPSQSERSVVRIDIPEAA